MKNRLYTFAYGARSVEFGSSSVGFFATAYCLARKGSLPLLRGLYKRLLFRSVSGRLFVGSRVSLWFPWYISAGKDFYIGDYSYINGLSVRGMVFGDHVRIREHCWIQATSVLEDLGHGLSV